MTFLKSKAIIYDLLKKTYGETVKDPNTEFTFEDCLETLNIALEREQKNGIAVLYYYGYLCFIEKLRAENN